ncbi:Eco57I restriction-modification methylase domain-containing protein [Candidatus Clostridium stratigraminis]|uniref:site-specific DNA-methyltransferase (adenine-specific) n=1 Tax=Candidatus Clostridium stratigraminis TaxID=3381661 RepID=A0ABW8T212_9CLOT
MDLKKEVQKIVERYTQLSAHYKGKNSEFKEETCRNELLNPFFRLLGWDIENNQNLKPQYREVVYEQNLGPAGRSDYTMTLSGVPVYYVEAKKPGVDVSKLSDPAFQTRRYGWSAKLQISVLTNFEYLIIYDTTIPPKQTDDCNVAILKKYHYKDYVDKFEEIYEILSRKTVYSGKFNEIIESKFGNIHNNGLKMPVDEYFLKQINRWRLSLGEHLYKVKKLPIDIINDVVQDFINQILFLRICEDKNLPLYHTLQDISNKSSVMQSEMERLFKDADKKYNSGLFCGKYIIFDLNSSIIKEIIEELYFPRSPYEFRFISPNLLGHVYEMFLLERITVISGNVILEDKSKGNNREIDRAIVTTPVEIVKSMTKRSLDVLCTGKKPNEILNLKIADISCGSGVFLIEALDYLTKYCVEWYKENDKGHLIITQNGDFKLPLEDKKQLLQSCIYGIDIDIHAVEVAKFNLLLKLLDDETEPSIHDSIPVLPDISKNILHGNSLIDFSNIDFTKLTQVEKNSILPFEWNNINYGNKFDLIIGNPPYVNTEDMNNLIPIKEVSVYKKKYKSSYRQFDKYFLFLERALQKVNDDGYVCYIVPNKFAKIKSGSKLRKLITDRKYVVQFTDFGCAQLFKDKTVYSSIVLLQKKSQTHFKYEEVRNVSRWWGNPDYNEGMVLSSNILTEMPWALVPNKEDMDMINKLYSNSYRLDDVANLFNGVQTSAEQPPVYWFADSEIIQVLPDCFEIQKFGKRYRVEKNILKRYFKPVNIKEKNLSSYDIFDTNKWIIFPYGEDGKIYPIDIIRSHFPNTWHYLLDRYDILKPKQIDPTGRRDVPHATNDTWYEYGRDQAFTAFSNTTKLIVGVLSKKPMYLYDTNDFVIASGGTAGYCAISEKPGSQYSLEYIQAYLTHPRTEWLLSIIGSDFEGGYYSRGTSVLEGLPIRKLDFTNSEHKKIYNDVVNGVRRIHDINSSLKSNITKTQITALQTEKQHLIKNVENSISLVYSI